jgi:uncharacterized membrane protein YgcG
VIPPLGPAARFRRAAVRDREKLVVARLQTLAPSLDGEPDPDFQARTRARLVAMAAVRQAEPEPQPALERLLTAPAAPTRWRVRLTSALAGAAVAVTAVAGVAAVSVGAGPGDALYGVKRGTEASQLALVSDSSRGMTLLEFAGTRLVELRHLLRGGAADPALLVETLSTMDHQTRDGAAWQARLAVEQADDAPLRRLAAWQGGQLQGLLALQDEIPAGASEQYTGSLTLLEQVGTRIEGLETSVRCPAGPATDGADALGPVPMPCVPGGAEPGGAGDSGGPGGAPQAPGVGGGDPSTGAGGAGSTDGSAGPGGGGLPTGEDTPVQSPGLPTDQPLPSLPSLGGLLPGQTAQQSSPSSSPTSGGLLPCVPTLTITC